MTIFTNTLDISEQDYRALDAVSYSAISGYIRDGLSAIREQKVAGEAMIFGSLLDCMIFTPADLDNRFTIVESIDIPDRAKEIIDEYCKRFDHEEMDPEHVIILMDEFDYYRSVKNNRINKIINDEGIRYHNQRRKMDSRTPITEEMRSLAIECATALYCNKYTEEWFKIKHHQEIINQAKFHFTVDGVPLKCMCDTIKIDHDAQLITISDLKTTGSHESMFRESVRKFRYDIQADLYRWMVMRCIKNEFKHYKVDAFQFIVINKNNRSPMIWGYKPNDELPQYIIDAAKEINELKKTDMRYSLEALNNFGFVWI